MCNPLAVMAVMAVASAAVQKHNSDVAAENQAKSTKDNALATYAANEETARQEAAQAFEQQTDRARQASQQLSQARVISAQGGGSLAARAFNIQSGMAEDYSRIDASLKNQQGSIAQANANVQIQTADKLNAIGDQFKANQLKFFSDVGEAAANAYGMHASKHAALVAAMRYRPDLDPEAEFAKDQAAGRAPSDW